MDYFPPFLGIRVLVEPVPTQRCVNESRGERVGPDSGRTEVHSHRLGQGQDRSLGDVVRETVAVHLVGLRRGDVYNRPGAALSYVRVKQTGQIPIAPRVDVYGPGKFTQFCFCRVALEIRGCIVDQDRGDPKPAESRVHQMPDLLDVCNVRLAEPQRSILTELLADLRRDRRIRLGARTATHYSRALRQEELRN